MGRGDAHTRSPASPCVCPGPVLKSVRWGLSASSIRRGFLARPSAFSRWGWGRGAGPEHRSRAELGPPPALLSGPQSPHLLNGGPIEYNRPTVMAGSSCWTGLPPTLLTLPMDAQLASPYTQAHFGVLRHYRWGGQALWLWESVPRASASNRHCRPVGRVCPLFLPLLLLPPAWMLAPSSRSPTREEPARSLLRAGGRAAKRRRALQVGLTKDAKELRPPGKEGRGPGAQVLGQAVTQFHACSSSFPRCQGRELRYSPFFFLFF